MTTNKKLIPHNKGLSVRSSKVNKAGYQNLLEELKSILTKGQFRAYKAVDNIKVQTYWQLGERIVREELKYGDRADYGKHLIDGLSNDLEVHKREIYRFVKFYRCYEIVTEVPSQLSWSHYVELININNKLERDFYQNKAVLNSWGSKALRQQIQSNLFQLTSKKEIEAVFKTKLPTADSPEVFRDSYDFHFIELPDGQGEKELEEKIVGNITMFLKSLGEEFTFSGRQVPIKIDGETHFIDLILFHKGIPCTILVDLKIGKLDSRDVGQMNKYVGYYRRNKQYDYEQDTIGLIICGEAGKEEVAYALDGLEEKIFVAKYKVKLPSESKIKKALKGNN